MASENMRSELPKRRRLQGSCDTCRQKKIRCDSAEMRGGKCSNCVLFTLDCTHIFLSRKAKHSSRLVYLSTATEGIKADSLPELQEKLDPLLQNILTPTYQAPTNPELMRETVVTLAQYARALESALAGGDWQALLADFSKNQASRRSSSTEQEPIIRPPSAIAGPSRRSSASSDIEEGLVNELVDHIDSNLVIDPTQERFFGPGSNYTILQAALKCSNEASSGLGPRKVTKHSNQSDPFRRRPEFWNPIPTELMPVQERKLFVFPEPDLLEHLLDLYFTNVNAFFPLLHRPTFFMTLHSGLHHKDRWFGGTVLAMCAVAARYSSDPRIASKGDTDSELAAGLKWFRQITLFLDNSFSHTPTLYQLYLYCVASIYLRSSPAAEQCWYLVGIAIRAAHDIGLNRKRESDGPTIRSELEKRIWWNLVLLDATSSVTLGRPRSIHPEDHDVDPLIECDDEYWESDDPGMAFKQPPGKISYITSFNHLLELYDILGSAQGYFYNPRTPNTPAGMSTDEWDKSNLAIIDNSLNDWINNLPSALRWDPYHQDKRLFNQSAALYTTFYHVQIMLYRPFIVHKDQNFAFSSLSICTNAARACSRLMEAQVHRKSAPLPHVQAIIFLSGLIILLGIFYAKRAGIQLDEAKEMEGVHRCVNALKSYERRWHPAGRFVDILTSLAEAGNLQIPTTSKRKAKSVDDHISQGYTYPALARIASTSQLHHQSSSHINEYRNHHNGLRRTASNHSSPSDYPSHDLRFAPPQSHAGLALPVHTEDLRRPIFQSLQRNYHHSHPHVLDDFEKLFSPIVGTNGLSGSWNGLESAARAGNAPGADMAGANDTLIWSEIPSNLDWTDWGAFISNMDALGGHPSGSPSL
ncbi:hypothetical protein FA15DRAFT_643500 [Coprinopsis marcescibilis]|uniref:Zn(2)-C6 fungal-type domain-containing protein n=1 Tax=Coprinopsis marcescibilis TaxID=230819 RepID=A0A5C3KR68_COPMA|nr:hypothetical protein FA15DRAFT_643500 [Coprinopsis marcescibilis]